jgi:hypothetical protein
MSALSAGLSSFTDQMTLNEITVGRKISHIWKVLQVGAKFLSFATSSRYVTDGIHRFKKQKVNR